MRVLFVSALAACTAVGTLASQNPRLVVQPAVQPGKPLQTAVFGLPHQPFVTLLDTGGGPIKVLGETLFLDVSPRLVFADRGQLSAAGLHGRQYPTPSNLPTGITLYWQALILDSGARNGLFRPTDGESSVAYAGRGVLADDILDPVAQGYTGSYDRSVSGRIAAAPPRTRVHAVVPSGKIRFNQPIQGALNPLGARYQHVYRAVDLAARGDEEVLVAMRWKPFSTVQDDTFTRFVVDVSHSQVVPDYTVGKFSALPKFPQSGLGRVFAQNIKRGETQVRLHDGPYLIRRANVNKDGYLDYPISTRNAFVYNGRDSLLLDLKMSPSQTSKGTNGQRIWLMVASSPRPDARTFARGTGSTLIDPHKTAMAQNGDNSMHEMQFVFAKVRSEAISPWRRSPVSMPDYGKPNVAAAIPPGASVEMEYRGADGPTGQNATAWLATPDIADRKPYIQYRMTLRAAFGGGVPSVDAVVIPIK